MNGSAEGKHSVGSRLAQVLRRLVAAREDEHRPVLWASLYFFALLMSYYVIRPIRDDLGIAGGTKHLPWLFLWTLGAVLVTNPLFAALVSHVPRRRFIPYAYRFFAAHLVIFYLLLTVLPEQGATRVYVARAFFVWTSVFNLFVVSVFRGFMADVFTSEQGKRLFGFIGLGGTLGAIAGAGVAASLASRIGPITLLLIATALLELAVFCVARLSHATQPAESRGQPDPALARGGTFGGIVHTLASPYLLGIALYMLLYTMSSTFLYFDQAHIVEQNFRESAARTAFFARIDLSVNVLAIVLQSLLSGRIIGTLGVGLTAALLPLITCAGFLGLAWWPSVGLLLCVQVVRRAGDYALAQPAREVFYTVVSRDEKYKAKNFIDTFVYRGGDALGAGVYGWLAMAARGAASMLPITIPLCVLWGAVALLLGRRQAALATIRSGQSA